MSKYTADEVARMAQNLPGLENGSTVPRDQAVYWMLRELERRLRQDEEEAKRDVVMEPSMESMQKWADSFGIGDWKIDDIRRAVDDARAI